MAVLMGVTDIILLGECQPPFCRMYRMGGGGKNSASGVAIFVPLALSHVIKITGV